MLARLLLISTIFAVADVAQSIEQLVDSNRLDDARQQLHELVRSAGRSPRTRLIEAMILYREGQHLPSMNILKDLLGPKQHDANVYKLFGLNLVAMKRDTDAEPFFRAAAGLAPEDTMALYYLGMAELTLLRFNDAERTLSEVVRRMPDYTAARTMLGLALEQQDKPDTALEAYRTAGALARRKGEPAVQPDLYLARYLMRLLRLHEAVEVLKGLVAAVPDHAEAHLLLGRSLSESGSAEPGVRHLQRALELDPTNRPARYVLARTLQRLGRTDAAAQHFQILRQDGSTGRPAQP